MSEVTRTVRAILLAQSCVESNQPLKPAVVSILLDEIMRLRRQLQASERRIARQEPQDE
jgi:hypothetical protein